MNEQQVTVPFVPIPLFNSDTEQQVPSSVPGTNSVRRPATDLCVDGHVPLQAAGRGEGAATDGTLEEARARVRPLVTGERAGCDEPPVQGGADTRAGAGQ